MNILTFVNGEITPSQCEFRKRQNLREQHDLLLWEGDPPGGCGCVYLDFGKEFNNISHSILVEELAVHGLDRGSGG